MTWMVMGEAWQCQNFWLHDSEGDRGKAIKQATNLGGCLSLSVILANLSNQLQQLLSVAI